MTLSALTGSILALYHAAQTLVASYTSILSYQSIRRVQTYEDLTEKAAQYSNVAESHLKTTRTTQGSGALSILLSLASSIYLAYAAKNEGSARLSLGLAITAAVGLGVSYRHISSYWRGKFKVPLPGSGDYNDAITSTNQVRKGVGVLAWSWALVAAVYAVIVLREEGGR